MIRIYAENEFLKQQYWTVTKGPHSAQKNIYFGSCFYLLRNARGNITIKNVFSVNIFLYIIFITL